MRRGADFMKKRIRDNGWYQNAVAICIGVLFFTILWKFSDIWNGIRKFLGFFRPVILGAVIAYIVHPLANFFSRRFKRIKRERTKTYLSNALAFLVVFSFLAFVLITMIPQLVKSVEAFAGNLNGYVDSFNKMLENRGISKSVIDISGLIDSSENMFSAISRYIIKNRGSILSVSANAGRGLVQWVIAIILSIYLVAEKSSLKAGFKRLLMASLDEDKYERVSVLLHRCDSIFNRYIVFSLVDAIIIGAVNSVFMTICGMEYVGLTSFFVSVTNLIPTFGPAIGAVIGGFILLMVDPVDALVFVIFTLILQACDGYIIKPKLFGDSLGVPGLWILVGVIVGGNMFGVAGILIAIPSVAVIDHIYGSYIITALEKKHLENKEYDSSQETDGQKEDWHESCKNE